MKLSFHSLALSGTIAAVMSFTTNLAVAQEYRIGRTGVQAAAVLSMAQAGPEVRLTKGHSKLLFSDRSFGTIIVGDDSIASTTIGTGNSIILTGLSAGSTNLIVLSETQSSLLEATIVVEPAAGALRSTVTVSKGASISDRYECRGNDCVLIEQDNATPNLSFLLAPPPAEAAAEEKRAVLSNESQ